MALSSTGSIGTARWADPDYIADKYGFEDGAFWIGRNPHDHEQAIGYKDDRHVLITAGSRGGKGRSIIVNNLALWKGSTVTYDPKGELPYITAPRRGDGNDICDGMGQEVYVLDPLGHSGVDEKYLAYYDPLDSLDPDDGEFSTWVKRIATSLIRMPESGDQAKWAQEAIQYISTIIMHVKTGKEFEDDERTLMTVYKLIMEGDQDTLNEMKRLQPDIPPAKLPDAHELLLQSMAQNNSCRGHVAMGARDFLRKSQMTGKYFESIRGEATYQLDWFKSLGIERTLNGGPDLPRRFDPTKLKTDPKGISVYIVMPVEDLKTYGPWVESVFTGIFADIRRVKGAPKSAMPILTFLDEFSSLGYQEYIASSLDNIAGEGMKLAIIVQNHGKLRKLYKEETESFYTNAGLELYFGDVGPEASKYLKEQLGETEIIKVAQNQSVSKAVGESKSKSIAIGHTEGVGGSESEALSTSESIAKAEQWNYSTSLSSGDTSTWGKGDGQTMGANYTPALFHLTPRDKSYGTNLSLNRGGSHSVTQGKTKGGGGSITHSQNTGLTNTSSSSWNRSISHTETITTGTTETNTQSAGLSESYHKKPLLEPHEFNAFFRSFDESDVDHPAYPGFALVRIQGEHPFFVRRSNYDQDPSFERKFSKDPVHGYRPLSQIPLLGYAYTEEHILPINIPDQLMNKDYEAAPLLRPLQRFKEGDEILRYKGPKNKIKRIRAPFSGRVVAVADEDLQAKTGEVLTLKADIPISDNERKKYEDYIYGPDIRYIEKKREEKEAKEKAESAARARQKQERIDTYNRKKADSDESRNYELKGQYWKNFLMISIGGLIGFGAVVAVSESMFGISEPWLIFPIIGAFLVTVFYTLPKSIEACDEINKRYDSWLEHLNQSD